MILAPWATYRQQKGEEIPRIFQAQVEVSASFSSLA